MLNTFVGWAEYGELAALFFFQAMATSMWLVPLSRILNAQGFKELSPYAYGTFAISAFFSPLIFGAIMDNGSPRFVFLAVAAFSLVAIVTVATRTRRAE